ncbi:MAG: DUF1599 domain-containing protein [Cytophagales bacterium]|nr:MAG: DUF1599 domain-containing protein [Cytophagales bacterium]TAF60479.1 MAG: DUF1599 domain-containing protein [Cytophagales bacterium]
MGSLTQTFLTTTEQFWQILGECRTLFDKKNQDYGSSWRILRLPSITDQIFIKAKRIRTVQEKKEQRIQDSIQEEFVGIINYAVMALIQSTLSADSRVNMPAAELLALYDQEVEKIADLLLNKNHDYGEAWRDMRVESITDIILMKLYRIKSIEAQDGKTLVSEGVLAGYQDILNYAVFAMIHLRTTQS